MNSSPEKILMPIYRLSLASIAVATLSFFYVGSVNSSPAANEQNQMHVMQQKESLIAEATNTATVTIEGFQFKPDQVQIKKGGKITFVNQDAAPHTATPEEGAKFTGTGRLKKGESKTVVFDVLGAQSYFCEIHPSMKGKITVVE